MQSQEVNLFSNTGRILVPCILSLHKNEGFCVASSPNNPKSSRESATTNSVLPEEAFRTEGALSTVQVLVLLLSPDKSAHNQNAGSSRSPLP